MDKAFVDYLCYPYDDSGVIEAAEMLEEDEVLEVYDYAKKTGNLDLLKGKRWSEYFEGVPTGI